MTTSIKDLQGKNIIVFDCEIKKEFGELSRPLVPGSFRDFDGKDFEEMGISVACAYSYLTGDFSAYLEDNLDLLAIHLSEADMVVGFNIDKFDLPLVRAHKPYLKKEFKTYDALVYSRLACGWAPGKKYYPKGLNLDQHLIGTFGEKFKKTEDAKLAPDLFKQGKMGQLISYCLADVNREKMLFENIWNVGGATTPTHG